MCKEFIISQQITYILHYLEVLNLLFWTRTVQYFYCIFHIKLITLLPSVRASLFPTTTNNKNKSVNQQKDNLQQTTIDSIHFRKKEEISLSLSLFHLKLDCLIEIRDQPQTKSHPRSCLLFISNNLLYRAWFKEYNFKPSIFPFPFRTVYLFILS